MDPLATLAAQFRDPVREERLPIVGSALNSSLYAAIFAIVASVKESLPFSSVNPSHSIFFVGFNDDLLLFISIPSRVNRCNA